MSPEDALHTARFARQEAANLLERHVVPHAYSKGQSIAVRRYALLEAFIAEFQKELRYWEAQHDALTKRFEEERREALMEQDQKEFENVRKEV